MKPNAFAKRSLFAKLVLFFILVMLVKTILSIVLSNAILGQYNQANLRYRLESSLKSSEVFIRRQLDGLAVSAGLLSNQAKLIDYTEFGLFNLLRQELIVVQQSLELDALAIHDHQGSLLVGVGESLNKLDGFERFLGLAIAGETRSLVLSDGERLYLCSFLPIQRDDYAVGVLVLGRELDQAFMSFLEELNSTYSLLRVRDRYVYSEALPMPVLDELVQLGLQLRDAPEASRFGTYLVGSKKLELASTEALELVCVVDLGDFMQIVTIYNTILIALTILLLLVLLAVGIKFYQHSIAKPIASIVEGIRLITAGDLRPPFSTHGQDEFFLVTTAFNEMCRSLTTQAAELERLVNFNYLILNNSPAGLLTFDKKRRLSSCNPKAIQFLALEGKPCLGSHPEELGLDQALQSLINESFATKVYSLNSRVDCQSSLQRLFSVSSAPLITGHQEEVGLLLILVDISLLQQMEEKMERAGRLAALGEMAAGVSHQIKNPLTVIRVAVQMLQEDFVVAKKESEYHQLLSFVTDELFNIDTLVLNFLDFARPKQADLVPLSMRELLDYCIKHLPWDKYPGRELELSVADDLPSLAADRHLLVQAFSNLLINALQATREGGRLSLRVGLEEEYGEGNVLCITIEDDGCGMDEAVLSKLFAPFYTTKKDGTGLGLAIVQRIVEEHGGQISVRSEPGQGSCFTLRFRMDNEKITDR